MASGTTVALHPDGGLLASAVWDGPITLWDLASGKVQLELTGHDEVACVACSPDGRLLARGSIRSFTGEGDKGVEVRVYDSASGKQLLVLGGHTSNVDRVALLGGVTVLEGDGQAVVEPEWQKELYRELRPSTPRTIPLRLIPYYAWGNRGRSEMTVWLPLGR